jgi:uncharacterized protein YndB with AHSA1/START domain
VSGLSRVEIQAEVQAGREDVWALLSTQDGLARWLDEVELDPKPGGRFRFRLLDATAEGTVSALDPPQHISFRWDWPDDPIGVPSIVALDAIDHGDRTHLTLRHVGFRSTAQRQLHEVLWRHWFGRLREAAGTRRDAPAEAPI